MEDRTHLLTRAGGTYVVDARDGGLVLTLRAGTRGIAPLPRDAYHTFWAPACHCHSGRTDIDPYSKRWLLTQTPS